MSEKQARNANASQLQTIDIVIPAYNALHIIQKSVSSSLLQELPAGWRKNIIIVDDGSVDHTVQYCRSLFKEQVQIISHEQNRGRSASRNSGWCAGSGKYVAFLDADCEWRNTNSLKGHLAILESGADVSTGSIIGRGQSFWAAYQNILQASREQDFSSGNYAAFTSANFAIKRSVLEITSGFDEGYRRYGFEDRDFLLRLIHLRAKVVFCREAAVMIATDPSLKDVCCKMAEAGMHSSLRFQTAHPEYYKRSHYGRIDCRIHGFPLTTLAILSRSFVPRLAKLGDKVITMPSVPFRIKWAWVKITSGLAYLAGTSLSINEK